MGPLDLNILVVDDNATDRLIVKSMLIKLRVTTIHEAEDGTIADSKLQTAADIGQPYDIVILDWNMPRANGLKLLQQIRSDSRLKQTKIIIMTATSNRDVVDDAIRNGANDFIVKPIELESLRTKIEKLMA